MKINKLVYIRNYGKFSNCVNSRIDEWDSTFKQINTIYAPNGSGKTSLSVLLGSIKGDTELILKKKSFGSSGTPEVKFIIDNRKELKFENGSWNKIFEEIEVFDSFYLEDNLYTIAVDDGKNRLNIFELPIFEQIKDLIKKESQLRDDFSVISKRVYNRKHNVKSSKPKKNYKEDKIYIQLAAEKDRIYKELAAVDQELTVKTENQREFYLKRINNYLSLFTDSIQLTDVKLFNSGGKKGMVYGISINGHNISITERNKVSLKYTLSDGDKNALGLAFFLARIDLIPNLDKYIVVVDDPFTSFDTQRKMTTITQLSRVANKVGQFFLLTHDLHFANDFNNACNSNSLLNLKIVTYGNSSIFVSHDIKKELLTGFNKDIMTLRLFDKGEIIEDPLQLREVIRCIRPSIEGIFRIKYYNYVSETQWLGDFINMIRNAESGSVFERLKPELCELEELNDYSKQYHHSNPNYLEVGISVQELKIYVKRTLALIEKI